jgi:WD40 repeat protein
MNKTAELLTTVHNFSKMKNEKGFFSRLFGGSGSSKSTSDVSRKWDIRSLSDLVESSPMKSGSIQWKKDKPSLLVTAGEYIGLVSKENTIYILDPNFKIITSYDSREKKVNILELDPEGKYYAFAEGKSNIVHFKTIKGPREDFQIETSAAVTALALGKQLVYAGLDNGEIETFPWSNNTHRKLLERQDNYKPASKIFNEPQSVGQIGLSSDNKRIAVIIGGILFVSDDIQKGKVTIHLRSDSARCMTLRFSDDGKYVAAGGGKFSASFSFGENEELHIKDAAGFLDIYDLDNDRKVQFDGNGYWMQNIFWSSDNSRLLCLFAAAPQGSDKWTKAMSFHSLDILLSGIMKPDSVTKTQTSVELGSGGIISPGGRLIMVDNQEDAKIGFWMVGNDFNREYPHSHKEEEKIPHMAVAAPELKKEEPALDAIVIIFNRAFPTSEQFAEEILDGMTHRGKTYRSWMRSSTPVRVRSHQNAQDQMAAAAIALVEFRKIIGDLADPGKIQFATFEGSQDINGSVLSHWH